jgi:cytochrome c oxidase subunit 2
VSEHNAATEPELEGSLHIERWEGIWVRVSLVLLVIFVVAITIAAVAYNIQVPGVGGRIDPNALDAPGSPFANPGVRELAPGKYEAHVVAQAWAFDPNPIVIPQGSEVTFYVTSRDIQHGFKIQDTNINMMILPGQISTLRTVFNEPGTFNIICHEYCGIAHHTMYGQLIVEPPGGAVEAAPAGEAAPAVDSGTLVTVTDNLTESAILTETGAITDATVLTQTDALTATGDLTESAPVTESALVTVATEVTDTALVTVATEVTGTAEVTATATVTQ